MASRRSPVPFIVAGVVGVLLIIGIRAFSGGDDEAATTTLSTTGADGTTAPAPRPGCVPVSVAASSEKAALMSQIATEYAASGREVNGVCYDVTVRSVASGTAERALAQGWDEDLYGPRPDVWTPAASTWIGLLRNDLTALDKPQSLVPDTAESVTSTPLGISMGCFPIRLICALRIQHFGKYFAADPFS